jgi:hypothetical protein
MEWAALHEQELRDNWQRVIERTALASIEPLAEDWGMVKVTRVERLGEYRLRLTFSDGVVGDIDLAAELWGEMFEPLRDPIQFDRVRVDPELGTLMWPNGADLDPEGLHTMVRPVQRAS